MTLLEYFKNDTILITGASGFVGRNLYEHLLKHGLNVRGTYYSHKVNDLIYCDLTNYEETEKLIKKYNVKYVFMFATKTYGAGIMRSNPNALIRENLYDYWYCEYKIIRVVDSILKGKAHADKKHHCKNKK